MDKNRERLIIFLPLKTSSAMKKLAVKAKANCSACVSGICLKGSLAYRYLKW